MIKEYEKFRIVDHKETNHFLAEVNWEDNKEISDCKIIKFTFPNGDNSYVKKEDLLAFLFVIGEQSEQSKIIPQKLTHSRWYQTVLGITAHKDIRKGEKIVVPVKISLPDMEEEVIGDTKRKLVK